MKKNIFFISIILTCVLLVSGCEKNNNGDIEIIEGEIINSNDKDNNKKNSNEESNQNKNDLNKNSNEESNQNKNDLDKNKNEESNQNKNDLDKNEESNQDNNSEIDSKVNTQQPEATKELNIYTINNDTLETEPTSVLILESQEITPSLIIDEVIKTFTDIGIDVKIVDIIQEDNNIIINFEKNCPPTINVGSGEENAILNSIAMSIMENIPDTQIIYRLDGEAYVSGHIELGIDEIYTIQ